MSRSRATWRGLSSLIRSAQFTWSYFFSRGELRKRVTEHYPDPVSSRTEDDLPPRSRGFLFNDIDACTGCRECEIICPTSCIKVETESGPDSSKKWVSVFDIDFGKCMFCGLCAEVCEPASLKHTRSFEGAAYETVDLIRAFGRGRVSSEQREKWSRLRQNQEMEL